MRQIILDTETTGLNPATGDRIIEIGCIELINRRQTGKTLHHYINPERDIAEGAFAVHGLSREFLSDKPLFAQIVDELTEFVKDAEVIIHNAPFDLSFLNNEFTLLKRPSFTEHVGKVVDTLVDARRMFPGKRNSLDALCERFAISNEHRTLHGALLSGDDPATLARRPDRIRRSHRPGRSRGRAGPRRSRTPRRRRRRAPRRAPPRP